MDITIVDNPKDREEMKRVLNEGWTFLVELCGDPPLAEHCACLIDLSDEDDRGDVEPFRGKDGIIHCTLGCECDGDGYETLEITCVRAYSPKSFNDKFPTFRLISIVDFVSRVCDAAAFDESTEEDIAELKRSYGVWKG